MRHSAQCGQWEERPRSEDDSTMFYFKSTWKREWVSENLLTFRTTFHRIIIWNGVANKTCVQSWEKKSDEWQASKYLNDSMIWFCRECWLRIKNEAGKHLVSYQLLSCRFLLLVRHAWRGASCQPQDELFNFVRYKLKGMVILELHRECPKKACDAFSDLFLVDSPQFKHLKLSGATPVWFSIPSFLCQQAFLEWRRHAGPSK